jgi:N-acetyl-anhydromuramyl-L-alanine amidase AmpD
MSIDGLSPRRSAASIPDRVPAVPAASDGSAPAPPSAEQAADHFGTAAAPGRAASTRDAALEALVALRGRRSAATGDAAWLAAGAPPPLDGASALDAAPGPRPRPEGIRFVPSQHHGSRAGTDIDAIVLHHTGGSRIDNTIRWFQNPSSKVSSHYIIGQDGSIVQMVDEARSAWHAGKAQLHGDRSSVNARSIGIELVNPGDGKTPFPEAQMQALARLTAHLADKYDVPVPNIVGHNQVALPPGRKVDPAPNFDWQRLLADVGVPRPGPAPGPVEPPDPGGATAEVRTLRRGSRGDEVLDAQRRLQAAGFDPGPLDGVFGPKTLGAVIAFQRSRGVTADGIVGPRTWAALLAA